MSASTPATAIEITADVAIIGGGPAGSACATYLARAGLKVVLFERETFPRFRIGESLLPLNLPILDELGLTEEMERRFIRKYAANFSDRYGGRLARYPFAKAINKNHPYAYQVERAEFDELLLDNARNNGATVYQPWAVREVLFEGDQAVGLKAEAGDGSARLTVKCPMVVDASGRSVFLGPRLGYKRDIALDSRTAFYSHFDGVYHDPGDRSGDIQIVSFPHGWFWMIPFKNGNTSVGMVVTEGYLRQRGQIAAEAAAIGKRFAVEHEGSQEAVAGHTDQANDAFLWHTIEATPYVADRMKNAKQRFAARSIANFSYRMERYCGPGYVMLGDAGAFLDPVFSSGVFLTMKSAQVASKAIVKSFETRDFSGHYLKDYETRIRSGQAIFFRFIRGWYDPAFLDLFYYSENSFSKDFLGLKTAITSVLAADLFDPRHLWILKLRINLLFTMAALHRLRLRLTRGGRSFVSQLPV
jgi:flavin-dependent dehydrogenase